jgi:hypothetical protein
MPRPSTAGALGCRGAKADSVPLRVRFKTRVLGTKSLP